MIEVLNIWDLLTLVLLIGAGYCLVVWCIRAHKRKQKNEAIDSLWERQLFFRCLCKNFQKNLAQIEKTVEK